MKSLSKKEKGEIGLILGSVLVVAIVGLLLTQVSGKTETFTGAGIEGVPTTTGVLVLMNNYCEPVNIEGVCDDICSSSNPVRTCFPVEDDCDVVSSQCLCCSSP